MTAPVTIRDATASDLETIVDFNCRLAWESEQKELNLQTLRPGVAAALADAAKARYFVAIAGEDIVGQIMCTYEWSDWRNGNLWWIQSVYVRPEFRRQGVFRALYGHVQRLAQQSPGVAGLRLYVEHHNHVAQQVYAELGMKPAGYHVLEAIW